MSTPETSQPQPYLARFEVEFTLQFTDPDAIRAAAHEYVRDNVPEPEVRDEWDAAIDTDLDYAIIVAADTLTRLETPPLPAAIQVLSGIERVRFINKIDDP